MTERNTCLSCQRTGIRSSHVLCRPCFKAHETELRQLEEEPWTPARLRQKLWGQEFKRNRTRRNRSRIAYAAYLLAREGDDELLGAVRTALSNTGPKEFGGEGSETAHLEEEARTVTALEEALGEKPSRHVEKPGEFRTRDGHWVRSKSERDIANYLFERRIRYHYERRLSIGDVDLHPDFYLPDVGMGVYLEHFGRLDEPRYRELAEKKAALFQDAGIPLIATDEDDAKDMETALDRKLGKFLAAEHHDPARE